MPRVTDLLKISHTLSSYTDAKILTSKSSWPGALFLLSDLNASSNSSSLNTVLFNVAFTVGKYDIKVRSL